MSDVWCTSARSTYLCCHLNNKNTFLLPPH
jgi:hypothetical protein